MRLLSFAGLVTAVVLTAVGCDGSGRVEVEGAVTYDGQPIKAGTVAFIPHEGKGVSTGGSIVDGRYAVPAMFGPKIGMHRVEIRWAKPTGSKFKSETGEMLSMTAEGLPDRYNNRSELTVNLTSGRNVADFDLKK